MITNICLLLEALSILLCLHYLYGEKFRLDIETVSFLAIDMIMMQAIEYYEWPGVLSMLIYPIIVVYCGIKFGFKWKAIIVNNILFMVIISSIQVIASSLYYFIFNVEIFNNIELLAVNSLVFAIVLFLLPKCKLDKVSTYLQDKERIYVIALFVSITVVSYWLIQYKVIDSIDIFPGILMSVSLIFICFLVVQIGKYKVRAKEIETELKIHKLYADSFQSLIENIRLRQHEFDNHIQTIYSQHYAYSTYEDLVNVQKDYCNAVAKENRYNKLLTMGNPVIIGFLYGKFVEIEKLGIDIDYKISIKEFNIEVPVYKIIEILGNLIKNATEALMERKGDKCLFVSMIEKDDKFEIEVRNSSDYIQLNEIEKFFIKGYSKKGNHRGLGLYNVKSICDEYMLDIWCENKNIENKNWLSFAITNKKETK